MPIPETPIWRQSTIWKVSTFFISYLFYPLLLSSLLIIFTVAYLKRWELSSVFAGYGAVRFSLLLAVEFIFPAKQEWKMTWVSFFRDLKYMVANGSVSALMRFSVAWLAIDLSRLNTGVVVGMPFVIEFVFVVLVFEFVQYWFHRWSHEGYDATGRWLWRMHVAHHLPDRVYLIMHVVAHPLNFVISTLLVNVPLVVLGARPETIFLYNTLMGLQGLVSHFNVDIKAGLLNYVLIGTELHRFHHSANINEAKNYGVLTPFWDIVFRTFRYDARKLPDKLGVDHPEDYPRSMEIFRVLALPFRRQNSAPSICPVQE